MTDEVNWVTFTATVPAWGVPELSNHANELVARAARPPAAEFDAYAPEAVRRAYFGVAYANWREFLKALAFNSKLVKGEPVPWTVLVNHLKVDPRQLSGALGAAQKFLDGRPPFERRRGAQTSMFIMRSDVADMILGFDSEIPAAPPRVDGD